jgi:hypothetical protein
MIPTPTLPEGILLDLAKLSDGQGVSEKHAATILGISVSKLQKDRVRGSGPRFVKHGRTKFARVTYRLGDLRIYQDENCHQSTSSYFKMEVDLGELGFIRPFAVFSGVIRDFVESLSEEPDEIVWQHN